MHQMHQSYMYAAVQNRHALQSLTFETMYCNRIMVHNNVLQVDGIEMVQLYKIHFDAFLAGTPVVIGIEVIDLLEIILLFG